MLNMNRKTASEDMRSQHLQNASADQSHARDMMYIRSQTFQNSNLQSNWREKRSPTLLDQNLVGLRKDQIVNNFMPSFGTKTSAFLQTPLAVENLTPKFLNIELNENVKSQENQISQDGRNKEAQRSPQRSINEPWRSNLLRKEENKAYALKQKLHFGVQLSEDELEFIRFPKSIEGMLGSKRALYETLNELDSKTLKVQMSELEAEDMALQHLKNEMIQFYPDCRIIPYGVRLLGMAHPGSAMYMFFDSGKQYFKAPHENKNKQKEVRERVYHKMKTCGHCSDTKDWDKQELVTFMHIDTGLNCVISFVNGFKERSTLLLRMFMKIDKRLRLLTLLVSDLIYQYHNISRMFTSYVLNIMIIMYLQKLEQPVLPTLQKLRESFNYEKVVIGSFNCGFPEDFKLPPSQNHLSVEELLKGFCNFYKNFNFNENIISIMGPNLKKSYFLPPYNTPVPQEEQICSYINDLKTSRNTATLNIDCPLVVQEPFELSSNSAEKVNGTVLTVFKVMCQDVTDILSRWC